jgi:hypothetical protein
MICYVSSQVICRICRIKDLSCKVKSMIVSTEVEASYFIMVGIYSSAISISEDSELRRSIRKFAIKESKLLDGIGIAHMEQEIQKRVLRLVKEQEETMVEQTGIQSSLDEQDMKLYLEQAINEVNKDRNNKK